MRHMYADHMFIN